SDAPLHADGISVAFADGDKRWRFLVPPSATSVRMPELPALAADWAPTAPLKRPVAPTVVAYESDLLPSYEAFKARYHFFVRTRGVLVRDLVEPWGVPEDGTVRRSSLGPALLGP